MSAVPHTFSYWRVWVDDDRVRVARDRYYGQENSRPHPEHLAERGNGRLGWVGHVAGARIGSVSLSAFTARLDQGGAASGSVSA